MMSNIRRSIRNMKKCKIEVIKTTFDEELAKEYGVIELPLLSF